MTSTTEIFSDDEDLLVGLTSDKALLNLKVKRLEETILTLMRKHTRNEDVIKQQAKEIKELSKAVEFLKCSLRSSEAKATLLEESLVLGRKIDKLHPPDQAASSSAVTDCVSAPSSTDIMKSLESLPALVSRLEAALGEASRPLQKPEKMPLQVSADDRWSEFRDKVSSLNLKLSVEPTFALVHPGPGEGLLDLSVVEPNKFNRNLYHISKISHERALVSCRSYTAYATAVLDDYFKPSVSLFCTCTGSSKGRAADRNERASLPKEALEVFLDHCCSIGTVSYEMKDDSHEIMKQRLQRAINMYLQGQRKKNNFVPTEAQLEAYSTSMHRGKRS